MDKDVHFNINAILLTQPKNSKITTHQHCSNPQINNNPPKNNNNLHEKPKLGIIPVIEATFGRQNINETQSTTKKNKSPSQSLNLSNSKKKFLLMKLHKIRMKKPKNKNKKFNNHLK